MHIIKNHGYLKSKSLRAYHYACGSDDDDDDDDDDVLGSGKNHKDAASVRATHPIPGACAIYYFEVKVISKGRDGQVPPNINSFNLQCCISSSIQVDTQLLSLEMPSSFVLKHTCN